MQGQFSNIMKQKVAMFKDILQASIVVHTKIWRFNAAMQEIESILLCIVPFFRRGYSFIWTFSVDLIMFSYSVT